eukprot:CAMPEP_0184720024 /NCGR_PEP_ID=MMETSP0314-20130426/9795_1 /TAXON_ID=38298 /ORGANISM="Rhodella maculata, Strain CCMP 736" /LENGTH=231 /DNA_ID=CAMNT_0027184003 /DNA_START=303 /DNA_END=994 /DNA_ORIENTATION=-
MESGESLETEGAGACHQLSSSKTLVGDTVMGADFPGATVSPSSDVGSTFLGDATCGGAGPKLARALPSANLTRATRRTGTTDTGTGTGGDEETDAGLGTLATTSISMATSPTGSPAPLPASMLSNASESPARTPGGGVPLHLPIARLTLVFPLVTSSTSSSSSVILKFGSPGAGRLDLIELKIAMYSAELTRGHECTAALGRGASGAGSRGGVPERRSGAKDGLGAAAEGG